MIIVQADVGTIGEQSPKASEDAPSDSSNISKHMKGYESRESPKWNEAYLIIIPTSAHVRTVLV